MQLAFRAVAMRTEPPGPSLRYTARCTEERAERIRQRRREERRQALLPLLVVDEVLADLDAGVRNAATLAVHRNAIVALIAGRVRLIVADDEPGLAAQAVAQQMGEA